MLKLIMVLVWVRVTCYQAFFFFSQRKREEGPPDRRLELETYDFSDYYGPIARENFLELSDP